MTGEGYEVELKVPLKDIKRLERTLMRLGAVRLNAETQHDEYYDHPCKSFRTTDEAVRIRNRIPTGEPEEPNGESLRPMLELTYKGPRVDPKSKTRVEVTLGVSELGPTRSFLEHVGFKYVATVTKNRVFYKVGAVTVSVDEVEGVGSFVEFEQIVESRDSVEPVRDMLLNLTQKLGLDPKQSIRDSYLELYLCKHSPHTA
jgi:adenylate cyclase class 2